MVMSIIIRNHQKSPRRAESQSAHAFHGSVHSPAMSNQYGFMLYSNSIHTYYHFIVLSDMLVCMKGKTLGIDYGAKRVGLALSDDIHKYAFAKHVLPNDDTLLEKITDFIKKEGVTKVVIGESDNPAGGLNTIVRRIEIFKRALEVCTELPVEAVSEAYSSAEARRALETKIKTRKNKKEPVDAAAAAIILQTYLDLQSKQE